MENLAPIAGPIAEIGAFGLVVWLVLHTFKHTIPRLAEDFKTSNARIMEGHLEAVTRLAAAHEAVIKEMREDQREDRRELLQKLDQLGREFTSLGLVVAQWQPDADRKRMEEMAATLAALSVKIDALAAA